MVSAGRAGWCGTDPPLPRLGRRRLESPVRLHDLVREGSVFVCSSKQNHVDRSYGHAVEAELGREQRVLPTPMGVRLLPRPSAGNWPRPAPRVRVAGGTRRELALRSMLN